MDQLAKGLKTTAQVVSVTENYDHFVNSEKFTMNCHLVIFRLDDGTEYKGQQCTTLPNTTFKNGDTIDIIIKSFTKGIYTFDVDAVYPNKITPQLPTIKGANATLASPLFINVMGTPRQMALDAAVRHYQNRIGVKPEDILATADLFADYLRGQTN